MSDLQISVDMNCLMMYNIIRNGDGYMSSNISTAKAIRALLLGGYICEICYNEKKRSKYNVFLSSDNKTEYYGTVVPSVFLDMMANDLLVLLWHKTDKYGNIYNSYGIRKE